MIKTLSTHNLIIPFFSPLTGLICSEYKLEIFIYDEGVANVSSQPAYTITKKNVTGSSGIDKIDISKLVNDFIEFTPGYTTGSVPSAYYESNQVWVKTRVFYKTTNEAEADTPQLVNSQLAVKGYGYYQDGENPQIPNDKILLTGREFKIGRGSVFNLPVLANQITAVSGNLTITDISQLSGDDYNVTFTKIGNYSNITAKISVTGADDFQVLNGTTSPQTIYLPFEGTSYDVQLIGFDNASQTNITSNTYTIVVP
jgi:hypothetical protein